MAIATQAIGGNLPLSKFTWILQNEQHQFLQPTLDHQQAALAAAKAILDPLATNVAQLQTSRRNESRRKRKRGSNDVEDPVLQLRQVYTQGLAVKQVWEQARRILDAACNEVEREIQQHSEKHQSHQETLNGFDDEDEDLQNDATRGSEAEDFDETSDIDLSEDEAQDDEDILSEELNHEDMEDIEQPSASELSVDDYDDSPQATYKPDPNNLNDGFFSIDDFNKQSQFLEQVDARGDDDNPSDEDEVDWDADPLSQPVSKLHARQTNSRREEADENNDSDGDASGPTFGDVDLNAPDTDDDDVGGEIEEGEMDGLMSGLVNTNDIRYADFFEPPPKKPSKLKRMRALPKTQPPPEKARLNRGPEDEDSDLKRAMADVHRDLFDSDEELEDDEDEEALSDEDDSAALPRLSATKLKDKNLSTHEKQKLQIAEEIKRLEAINVSKKPWTLSGETSAQARPLNSLIEEDLEFERTGKPVPVITAETTNDIEALIKRRILARDFDEIVRRLPTALSSASDTRRGRLDAVVDDTKPNTGLGEMYENEYQKNTDPSSYVDKRSAATKRQHDEISKLWREVREQLDVLANLHIKPKRAEIEIKTVEDRPRIAMEDAQPAVSGNGLDDANGTMLAPQEIYKPGTDSKAEGGEVVGKDGASRSKEEMTREEKLRRRRRDKERLKKAGHSHGPAKSAMNGKGGKLSRKDEKEQVLKDLAKGGAKLIGKDGVVQRIDGKKKGQEVSGHSGLSGGALKL